MIDKSKVQNSKFKVKKSVGPTSVGKYDHKAVEAKWSAAWKESKLNQANIAGASKPFVAGAPQGKPYYNLMMFPYPSAEGLHVGNMYAFTGSDIYGRYKRMGGHEVFEPIGLDGFGIHSENYALKIGRHPMDHAVITQKNFYNQLGKIGAMFDWSRTVETYDTDYYRWTQWLFVQMFKHGLAYRARASVNFCPSCKTVLADEQVIDGACERCGSTVEKRSLEQWFFRITDYAERLLGNLKDLDWTAKVKIAQRNWIGKKEGIKIDYPVKDSKEVITCFTTAPVNFGMTFIVVSPEYELVAKILSGQLSVPKDRLAAIRSYVDAAAKRKKDAGEKDKTGVFTGLYATNRVAGWDVPVWISDFVLKEVGTGAVQGCPAHDYRDFEFAQKFGLPIKRVVVGPDGDTSEVDTVEKIIVSGMPGSMVNSKFLDGLDFASGLQATMDYVEKNGWGKRVTTYHLRDWLISRQRYWGPPIPMIYCEACAKAGKGWFTTDEAKTMKQESSSSGMAGWYPVPDNELPVVLPRIEDYKPGTDGVAPLAKHKEFYETTCPGCGGKAVRETDVSDTFLDSSWYFLRYPSVGNPTSGQAPFDPATTKKWLPVDMYTGGAEHSVLHLMYSRFIWKALRDWGYLDFSAKGGPASLAKGQSASGRGWDEPFTRFFAHGLVIKDGSKMSKSKGNVVNPDEYIAQYGADALRLYLMFMGPFSQGGDFRDSAMEGMSRWIGRVWKIAMGSITKSDQSRPINQSDQFNIKRALARLVKKVGDDLEARRYNTAIASMMEFTNLVSDNGGALSKADFQTFTLLLAPFAPHLAEELWSRFAGAKAGSVHTQPWPRYDASALSESEVPVVVQVNGKLRDRLMVPSAEAGDKTKLEARARACPNAAKYLEGHSVKKVIIVPGKLVNFVV